MGQAGVEIIGLDAVWCLDQRELCIVAHFWIAAENSYLSASTKSSRLDYPLISCAVEACLRKKLN